MRKSPEINLVLNHESYRLQTIYKFVVSPPRAPSLRRHARSEKVQRLLLCKIGYFFPTVQLFVLTSFINLAFFLCYVKRVLTISFFLTLKTVCSKSISNPPLSTCIGFTPFRLPPTGLKILFHFAYNSRSFQISCINPRG